MSDNTWKAMPGQPRVCSGCHQKLTLNDPEPLWFDTLRKESWHFYCKVDPGLKAA